MRFETVRPSELDAGHRATWLGLVRQAPALGSPYFHPAFTQAVAAVRDDVRVTVMECDNRVVGYFPFQVDRFGGGRPVGGRLSDSHGLIARAEAAAPDVGRLLRASRLSYWEFDHLVDDAGVFTQYQHARAASPCLDLTGGYAAYRGRRLGGGAGRLRQFERKARKLEREVGPVRFVAHERSSHVFDFVLRKKAEQCRRTGVEDFFAWSWTRELLERILEVNEAHFAGTLSALYAGDHLLAAHLGMRSDRVWHWWFPVYEQRFSPYSPGGILLLRVAEAAAHLGLATVDLGKGEDAYKASFATHEVPLFEGRATRPSVAAAWRWTCDRARHLARTTPMLQPVRPALRTLRAWATRLERLAGDPYPLRAKAR